MPESTERPIVVGFDASPASETALAWAAAEAGLRHTEVSAVMAAVPSFGPSPQTEIAWMRFAEAEDRMAGAGVKATLVPCFGLPVTELQHHARRAGADLLVVGRRGLGPLARLVTGSVSETLGEYPRQALAVIPEAWEGGKAAGRILVGVDGSPSSLPALRWAIDEGDRRGTIVEVVRVRDPGTADRANSSFGVDMAELDDVDRVNVVLRELKGHPVEVLLHESVGADMLVVGTRRLGPIGQLLLGSTSHTLIQRSAIPLVVVPTPTVASARRTSSDT
jgi:nucleotide-binding universal stress UspA family protein